MMTAGADNKPQTAEAIEREFKLDQIDLSEAIEALETIGFKPKRAEKLALKWMNEVEAEEPILYGFRIWIDDKGDWWHSSDAKLLRPSFLDEFVILNKERLTQLKRVSASWQPRGNYPEARTPWLDFFWEESENEARCVSGYFATEKFREILPIPPGVPYRNDKMHKLYFR
jgi:hypothetical protein